MKETQQYDAKTEHPVPPPKRAGAGTSIPVRLSQLGIILAFIVIVAIFSILKPQVFLSMENLTNIVKQTAVASVVGFGMTIVMLAGGIDLSVGSIIPMCGVVAALLLAQGIPIPIAILAALLLGTLFGFINGFVSVRWKIQPFLVTLGSMSVARGLALIFSGGKTVYIDNKLFLNIMGRGNIGPVPVLLIWTLVFLVISWALINRSTYGRRVRAVGGNETAARQSGVRVGRVRRSPSCSAVLCGFRRAHDGRQAVQRCERSVVNGIGCITAAVLGGTGFAGGWIHDRYGLEHW